MHRDLKLGNLVLHRQNRMITITNFCLGKHLVSEDDLLRDQRGSPAYISPDVLSGRPYLGRILYLALGKKEILRKSLNRETIRFMGTWRGFIHHALWPISFLRFGSSRTVPKNQSCRILHSKVRREQRCWNRLSFYLIRFLSFLHLETAECLIAQQC